MKLAALLLVSAAAALAADPQVVILWPNGAPGSEGKDAPEAVRVTGPTNDHVISSVHKPSITVYLPPKAIATGAAVVIAPGGGHSALWVDHEGINEAKWLSDHGVAGFVLKYRLAREPGSTYTIEGHALGDMQRAIRTVRARAAEWGIDPARVGIMGFSAGGELVTLAAMRYDPHPSPADDIDKQDAKPAFQALIYPGHVRDIKLAKDQPPAFLACGENDRLDISQGLPELYLQMKKAGMSAELHVYTKVGHGFGMRATDKGPVSHWIERFQEWLDSRGLLKK
jgi:endo-1,4-beta-xylanase